MSMHVRGWEVEAWQPAETTVLGVSRMLCGLCNVWFKEKKGSSGLNCSASGKSSVHLLMGCSVLKRPQEQTG